MAAARRLTRDRATELLTTLLARVCARGPHADCVTAVHVFGSYARGAEEVGDVDVHLTYDLRLNAEVKSEALARAIYGQDGTAPFRKALRPSRSVQMFFNELEILPHPVLVYQQGDTLEQALKRVHGIVVDPRAGRAQRDAMHPSLEPVADELRPPSRIMLTELAANGYIALELLELADADLEAIADPHYRHHVARRWTPTSPLARAARAAGSYLQAGGADLTHVRLMGEVVLLPDMAFSVEAREDWLGSLVHQTGREDMTEAVFVLRPNLKRPLRALRIVPLDAAGLRDIADLDLWLSEHAPHIGHLTNSVDQDRSAGRRSAASTPPPPTGPPPRGS